MDGGQVELCEAAGGAAGGGAAGGQLEVLLVELLDVLLVELLRAAAGAGLWPRVPRVV